MGLNLLHIPSNTPYVSKIRRNNDINSVNGGDRYSNTIGFSDVLENLDDEDFWRGFDICHIHYGFEFEEIGIFKRAISEIRRRLKPIVYTCHEIESVHGIAPEAYKEYQDTLFQVASSVITLTSQCAEKIGDRYSEPVVIPHGAVLCEKNNYGMSSTTKEPVKVTFFGKDRNNRNNVSSYVNTVLASEGMYETELLTSPFSDELLSHSLLLNNAIQVTQGNKNAKISPLLPLNDAELYKRLASTDLLVLPYTSGGHSGQLELALDLGILPIFSDIGFIKGQLDFWPTEISELVKSLAFNWSDEQHWNYSSRLISSIKKGVSQLESFREIWKDADIGEMRENEYIQFLDSHSKIYHSII